MGQRLVHRRYQASCDASINACQTFLNIHTSTIGCSVALLPPRRKGDTAGLRDLDRIKQIFRSGNKSTKITIHQSKPSEDISCWRLIRDISPLSTEQKCLRSRVVFVLIYDIHVARLLVLVVSDIWLNACPPPPWLLSTSGMKQL